MNNYQRWHGIMKCYPFEEKRLLKWEPPFIVQPKYDGVRCRAIYAQTADSYMLLSSEENVIFSVPHINQVLNDLKLTAELDGELYCHGMSFEEIVSITSRTVNLHDNSIAIKFHVFDIVNEEPQMRRTLLIEALRGISPFIQIAPFYMCESLDDIMRAYDQLIKDGYEGIIVRHKLGKYEKKRSTAIMKFKPKKDDVYEILGKQEEVSITGIPKGTLGALVLRSGDGDTFKVGTGFTQEQRQTLWEAELTGMKAKIAYQHLTDRKVPRFPVFVEVIDHEKVN